MGSRSARQGLSSVSVAVVTLWQPPLTSARSDPIRGLDARMGSQLVLRASLSAAARYSRA